MVIEILPLEPEELKQIRSRLALLRFLILIFVCPLYILLVYEGISSLIYIVRTGFQLPDLLLIAFVIIFNYLIFRYLIPFYRVAADDSKLKTKHVIRTIILKVEEEFVSDMGTRYVVYTDLAPPIISTQTVLIFKTVDYSRLVEGQPIRINSLDRDCKRLLSIETYSDN